MAGRSRGESEGRVAAFGAAMILSFVMCAGARAQQPPGEDSVLGGPPVPDEVARTLVRFNASGKFQRAEGRPEEAALMLLPLDPDAREYARQAISDREEALQQLLIENIDTLKEASDAVATGDGGAIQKLAKALYDRFDPAHQRDPLMAPLEKVLGESQTSDLKRLLDEYWAAWIKAERRGAKETDEQARDRLALTLFQEDIRRAYDRTLRPIRDRMERINQAAAPTPEQKAAIREVVIDYIKETHLKPTPEQKDQVARKVYQILDEEQRIKVFTAALSQL